MTWLKTLRDGTQQLVTTLFVLLSRQYNYYSHIIWIILKKYNMEVPSMLQYTCISILMTFAGEHKELSLWLSHPILILVVLLLTSLLPVVQYSILSSIKQNCSTLFLSLVSYQNLQQIFWYTRNDTNIHTIFVKKTGQVH